MDIEKIIIKQLLQLVPSSEILEIRANIGDKSCSVEFFATINGSRTQCYEMIDNGLINEKDFDKSVKEIARRVRLSSEYKAGEINKIRFTFRR